MTMLDDDARDLAIHRRIERAVQTLASLRMLSRADVLSGLSAGAFEPACNVICELEKITRAELSERITAFIENEAEESRANAVPENRASWRDAQPA